MGKTEILIHFTFILMGILPAILLMYFYKNTKPKYYGIPMFGLLLISLGALVVAIGIDFSEIVKPFLNPDTPKPDYEYAKNLNLNIQVWAYVFPGASIALGVNLITEFLLREAPSSVKT